MSASINVRQPRLVLHLPGPAFDEIRSEIVKPLACKSCRPFPHQSKESNGLQEC